VPRRINKHPGECFWNLGPPASVAWSLNFPFAVSFVVPLRTEQVGKGASRQVAGLTSTEQAGKGASGKCGTYLSVPERAPAGLKIPNLRIKFWQLRVNVERVSGGALGVT
jgi:hypothetical protein